MNFVEGNVRRKALPSVSWVLFLDLMPAAHTKACALFASFETYSKIIEQYDFILGDQKSTKMQNSVGAKRTICHHASWRV